MVPLPALYDEHIDGSKLTEQKKPFEYIVPTHTKVGRNKYLNLAKSIQKSLSSANRALATIMIFLSRY